MQAGLSRCTRTVPGTLHSGGGQGLHLRTRADHRRGESHMPRQLKTAKGGRSEDAQTPATPREHHCAISKAAAAITEPRKGEKFKESPALKTLRRQALRAPSGEDRRNLWKAACSQRKGEYGGMEGLQSPAQ